jgi:hypothetical protein
LTLKATVYQKNNGLRTGWLGIANQQRVVVTYFS